MFCCCYYYCCCCWLPCHNIWVYDAILSYVNNLIVCGLSTVLFDHKRGCFYGRVWLGTVDDDNRHKPIIHGTSSAGGTNHLICPKQRGLIYGEQGVLSRRLQMSYRSIKTPFLGIMSFLCHCMRHMLASRYVQYFLLSIFSTLWPDTYTQMVALVDSCDLYSYCYCHCFNKIIFSIVSFLSNVFEAAA